MPFNCKPFAAQVAQMKLQGIKQIDLCKKSGIPESVLSGYLTGRTIPSIVILDKLCTALDCTPNDIIGRD